MSEFNCKIKIDLTTQSILPETPKKRPNKKKKRSSGVNRNRSKSDQIKKRTTSLSKIKIPTEGIQGEIKVPISTGKKKRPKKKENSVSFESEAKKINSNSIISLTSLPNNENSNKFDQAQKLSFLNKKKPRHWEKRWVLFSNVFEFTKEIWVKKWVLVDDINDPLESNGYQNCESGSSKGHKEPKKHQCPLAECAKIFTDSSSLKKHQLTHGERTFICDHEDCGKKFLDNSKLRRHMLVHTGEKPFKCDLCGKKFSLDFNLKTHLRTHTGEKPYICSYAGCDKRFTQSSNLTAHEKTHKDELAASERKEGKLIFGLNKEVVDENHNENEAENKN